MANRGDTGTDERGGPAVIQPFAAIPVVRDGLRHLSTGARE